MDPYSDWDSTNLLYLYDRGLVAGVAQGVLALVINFWDALDRKQDMPIIPTAPEVHYRDGDRQVWDLAVWVMPWFDPTAYEWGARPAIAGS